MGRRQARGFRPDLASLEVRMVLSASDPVVHTAIVPVAVPIGTYNNTFTQINNAFEAYEGPLDDTINAIGSFVSGLVSTVLSPGSASDPSSGSDDSGSLTQDSKGDAGDLQSRLITAVSQLPGGQAEADSLVNRTFASGGLTTEDASYFKGKLTAMVKQAVTQEVHRGDVVLVWPGEAAPGRRA